MKADETTYLHRQLERYAEDLGEVMVALDTANRRLEQLDRVSGVGAAGQGMLLELVAYLRKTACLSTDTAALLEGDADACRTAGWLHDKLRPGDNLSEAWGELLGHDIPWPGHFRRDQDRDPATFERVDAGGWTSGFRIPRSAGPEHIVALDWVLWPSGHAHGKRLDLMQQLLGLRVPLHVVICDNSGVMQFSSDGRTHTCGLPPGTSDGQVHPLLLRLPESGSEADNVLEIVSAHGEWEGTRALVIDARPCNVWVRAVRVGSLAHGFSIVLLFFNTDLLRQCDRRSGPLLHFDPETGLLSRSTFLAHVGRKIESASPERQRPAILFIEIIHFSPIYGAVGSEVGDAILQAFVDRLGRIVRTGDVIGRVGESRFCLLVEGGDVARKVRDRIQRLFGFPEGSPVHVDGRDYHLDVALGIALNGDRGETARALLARAECAALATPEVTAGLPLRPGMVETLEALIRAFNDPAGFRLLYQPQVCCQSGRIRGVEALVRMQYPGSASISPSDFIPLAEQYGMIQHIDHWVVAAACRQLADWHARGINVRMAVNISATGFCSASVREQVAGIVEQHCFESNAVEFEITETAAMAPACDAYLTSSGVRARGISLAIDDFGTGYSNLARLRELNVSRLKIDAGFIRDITKRRRDRQLVESILAMATSLGLQSVAEGVESREQMSMLEDMGCDEAQGFALFPPMPADAMTVLLSGHTGGQILATKETQPEVIRP